MWHQIVIVVSCTNASAFIHTPIRTIRTQVILHVSRTEGYKVFLTLLQNTHQYKQWSFMLMIPFLFHLFLERAYCSEAVYQTWNKSDAIDGIQWPTVAIPDLSYVNNIGYDKTIWSLIIDHFIHSFIWRVRYPVFCPRGATDVFANRVPLPGKISDNDRKSTTRCLIFIKVWLEMSQRRVCCTADLVKVLLD